MLSSHKNLKNKGQDSADENPGARGADLIKSADSPSVARIVDRLLEYGVFEGASDIHIEPEEKGVLARYRVDGVLKTILTLPKKVQPGVTAHLKILANLDINERRLPQEGRFKISAKDYKAAFKISIIPAANGEKIIIQPLSEQALVLNLGQLGFQPSALETFKKNIARPRGLTLVAGPAGSGKTTTLYSILNILNRPEVNTVTIEDPIECRLPYVNQSQVKQNIGYTFAVGLRAFLRQDPNIILVGEINDRETAETAFRAASGHLVLSSLRAHDALSALSRLSEMGVSDFLPASTGNLIVAQRLIKKICPNCIQSHKLDKQTVAELEQLLDLEKILAILGKNKTGQNAKLNFESMLFYRGHGCKQCFNSGYQGKLGIFEVLEITSEISELILKKSSSAELKKQAEKQGRLTMIEDGFIKAKNGITTMEEIIEATKK